MKKFKVSVVVPIYNVEDYLEETIESIVSQTIGFDNIELILVNDGSTDKSEQVCLKYKEKYKNNIIYIKKENSGVSESRNIGFSKSTAEYVMFLDSDDLINDCFLLKMYDFLEKNKNINFVISRVKLFEAVNKWHYTDYMFKSNKKIVDINKDLTYLKYHSTGVLFRRDVIKNIRFDKNIKYGEDMKYMSEVLLQNEKYGLSKDSILYYRKRIKNDSAVNKQFYDKSYYINTINDSFIYIFNQCIKKYGCVTKYFQYYIMNSLFERTKIDSECIVILTKKEKEKYYNNIDYLLKYIDNDVILGLKRININDRVYFFKLKNGEKYKLNIKYSNNKIYVNDVVCDVKYGEFLSVIKIEKTNNRGVKIYLKVNDYLFYDKIYALVNGKKEMLKVSKNTWLNDNLKTYRKIDGIKYYDEKIMYIELKSDCSISFITTNDTINYGITSNVFKHNDYPKQYKRIDNKIVYMNHKTILVKSKYQIFSYLYCLFYNFMFVLKRKLRKIKGVRIISGRFNNN